MFLLEPYGPDCLYTANVLGSIAQLYDLQGRYDDAEKAINRVLGYVEEMITSGQIRVFAISVAEMFSKCNWKT